MSAYEVQPTSNDALAIILLGVFVVLLGWMLYSTARNGRKDR